MTRACKNSFFFINALNSKTGLRSSRREGTPNYLALFANYDVREYPVSLQKFSLRLPFPEKIQNTLRPRRLELRYGRGSSCLSERCSLTVLTDGPGGSSILLAVKH